MRIVELILHKDKLDDFDFLKDYPTKTFKKDDWYKFLYFEPIGEVLDSQTSPKMLLSFSEGKRGGLGWVLVRNFPIGTLQGDLLDLLKAFDTYKLKQKRTGGGIEFAGLILDFVAYGLYTREDVSLFMRIMYVNGYDFEEVLSVFTGLVKRKSLLTDFLKLASMYYFKEVA